MLASTKLRQIQVNGYKSIAACKKGIDLGDVTVLLGANGAGKSNLVSLFELLAWTLEGRLQDYLGGRSPLTMLWRGPKTTQEFSVKLLFDVDDQVGATYSAVFRFNPERETLLIRDLTVLTNDAVSSTMPPGFQPESHLADDTYSVHEPWAILKQLIGGCRVFQFHDTSPAAACRLSCYREDNQRLHGDAGNLAAVLLGMLENSGKRKYYDRIVRWVQSILPQFDDFALDTSAENEQVRLNWREKGSDYLLSPQQLSDGSIRFISLATLLLQPPESLPGVIVLDEPELGLHPAAISSLAGMIHSASKTSQVILACQSVRLVDEFSPEQIMVVERDQSTGCTGFRRLDVDALSAWLESYSLSELWEKNVIGGRP